MKLFIRLRKDGSVKFTKANYNLVLKLNLVQYEYNNFLSELIRNNMMYKNLGTSQVIDFKTFCTGLIQNNYIVSGIYNNKQLNSSQLLYLVKDNYRKNSILLRNLENENIDIEKLMVEYNRCLLVKDIFNIDSKNHVQMGWEFDLLESMGYGEKINDDPIFGYKNEYHILRYKLKKRNKDIPDEEINNLLEIIENKIKQFLSIKKYDIVRFGFENNIFYCGEIKIKIKEEIQNALFWKLEKKNITNKNLQIFLILKMLLRYRSMINVWTQWNLPNKFYENLYNNDYNCEAMSSPLNSQFLLLDYRNNVENTVFCSLFYDTDKYFGSIGNFYEANIQNYKNVIVCEQNPKSYIKAYEYLHTKNIEDYIFISLGFQYYPINFYTSLCFLENNTLSHVTLEFSLFTNVYIQLANDVKKINIDLNTLQRTYDFDTETKKNTVLFKEEWKKYLLTKELIALAPTSKKEIFFWPALLENLISIMILENPDTIFKQLEENSNLYSVLRKELQNNMVDNSEQVLTSIKNKIKIYLDDTIEITNPDMYGYDGTNYFVSNHFIKHIGQSRNRRLIDKLSENKKQIFFNNLVLLVLLRQEILLYDQNIPSVSSLWYKFLYFKFGVRLEGFVSPITSQLLMLEKNGSNDKIFYGNILGDIDQLFGSIGNIFNFDISTLPRIDDTLGICLAMPFNHILIEKAYELLNSWFTLGIKINIFIIVPYVKDSKYINLFESHKYLLSSTNVNNNIYYKNYPQIEAIMYIITNNKDSLNKNSLEDLYNKFRH